MRTLIVAVLVSLLPLTAGAQTGAASPDDIRKRFDSHAKDIAQQLQTTTCRTIKAEKVPGKTILECNMRASNSLLSIDAMNNQITGIWLMVDSTKLDHASDTTRAGGTLIRMARNTTHGNHLQIASQAMEGAHKTPGKASCVDDSQSSSRLCITTEDGRIYDMTLDRIPTK